MDTVQHSAHGYLLGYATTQSQYIAIVCAAVGALPDMLGMFGLDYLHDSWRLYNKVHGVIPLGIIAVTGTIFTWFGMWKYFLIFSTIALHLLIDIPWHNPNPPYGWYSWGDRADAVGWFICAVLGILLFC